MNVLKAQLFIAGKYYGCFFFQIQIQVKSTNKHGNIPLKSKLENLTSCHVILFPLLLSALFQAKITQMIPRWYILELHFARKCQAYQAHIYDRGKLEGELSKVGKILLSLAKSIRQVRHWNAFFQFACVKNSLAFSQKYISKFLHFWSLWTRAWFIETKGKPCAARFIRIHIDTYDSAEFWSVVSN